MILFYLILHSFLFNTSNRETNVAEARTLKLIKCDKDIGAYYNIMNRIIIICRFNVSARKSDEIDCVYILNTS